MKKEKTTIGKVEMLDALMENIPDTIYFKDLKSRFIGVNKALIKSIKARNSNEVLGKTDFDFYSKELSAKTFSDEQDIIKTGTPLVKTEENENFGDRVNSWVVTTKMPLHDREGKIIGTFGISRDISDIKKAEKDLKHLNNVLRAIRNINQLIVKEKNITSLIKNACNILTRNRDYYYAWIALFDDTGKITGHAEAGVGKNFVSFIENLKKGRTPSCWQKAMSGSGVVLIKNPEADCINCPISVDYIDRGLMIVKLVHIGKVYGIISASIPLEYIENKQERALFGEITDDIAFALYNLEQEQKRKQMLEKLKIAKIEAEESSKKALAADSAKSEFLANMSHEIRTPMNAIMGFSEILKEQLHNPKYLKYIDTILSSGKTLLGLINDILDLSKIEAGKMEFQYRPVDPHALFGDIAKIFSFKINNKGIKLITDIDDKLPRSLLLDEVRMRQILFNLVGNAVKFTDEGYIELKVKGSFYPDRSKIDLIFSVKDTGIGISEEDKNLIFDAFQQSKGQSTKKYGGTGLGLAITKKLVELMNGEISIDSIVGKGSTFKIIIKEVSVATIEADIEEGKTEYDNVSFCGQKVLIVDDIQSNRMLLSETLSLYNLHILEAENGKEAINIAQIHNPDIILMDLRMPVMDGYEAIKILKADSKLKSIPVIVLTASAMKSSEEEIKNIKCEGYVRKPISRSELFVELKKYLDFKSTSGKEKLSGDKKKKEDLADKTDMRAIEKLPQLIGRLENETSIKYQKVKKGFIINDIEDFAEEMQNLGKEYSAAILSDWGRKLSEQAGNFDLENLISTFNEFGNILGKIKSFSKGMIKNGKL